MWCLPFSYVRKIADRMGRNKVKILQRDINNIIWAINVVDNYVIKSTCLTKAITAQILLRQHNYVAKIKIGVIKDETFEAHAWVEVDGQVIIGISEKKYVSLIDL